MCVSIRVHLRHGKRMSKSERNAVTVCAVVQSFMSRSLFVSSCSVRWCVCVCVCLGVDAWVYAQVTGGAEIAETL